MGFLRFAGVGWAWRVHLVWAPCSSGPCWTFSFLVWCSFNVQFISSEYNCSMHGTETDRTYLQNEEKVYFFDNHPGILRSCLQFQFNSRDKKWGIVGVLSRVLISVFWNLMRLNFGFRFGLSWYSTSPVLVSPWLWRTTILSPTLVRISIVNRCDWHTHTPNLATYLANSKAISVTNAG